MTGVIGTALRGHLESDYSLRALSRRDLANLVRCCIDAPAELTYEISYALSDNRWSSRDIEHARRLVGYHPLYHAEDYH